MASYRIEGGKVYKDGELLSGAAAKKVLDAMERTRQRVMKATAKHKGGPSDPMPPAAAAASRKEGG